MAKKVTTAEVGLLRKPHPLQTRANMLLLALCDLDRALYQGNKGKIIKCVQRLKRHAAATSKEYHKNKDEIKELKRKIKQLEADDASIT